MTAPYAWMLGGVAASALVLVCSRTARRFVWTSLLFARVVLGTLTDRMRGRRGSAPLHLRAAFEQLGPTYVKLAQLVASSEGMFPDAYCNEFRRCLDRVPSFAPEIVRATVECELGRKTDEIFASFEPTPMASASIAQVHAATLRDGTDVVVKVQRPGLDEVVSSDLRVLGVFARIMEKLPLGDLANPRAVVEDFAANLADELDFRREAANMDEFNEIMQRHGLVGAAAPQPMHHLCTARVLVMERFHGYRVDDVENLAKLSDDSEGKLILGMRAWFRCLLVHGFFHGDVHAGNLMALTDGRIGFLDFGIVGRFDSSRRKLVTDFLLAIATRNFMALARAMVEMGRLTGIDEAALARDLEKGCLPFLDPSRPAKYVDLLPVMMRITIRHRMRMPRDFVLIMKQMIYFDRYAKLLAPNLNIFSDPRIIAGLMGDVALAQQQAA